MTKGIKTDKAMAVLIPAFRRLYTFCSDEALVQYWTHLPGVPTTFGQEFEKKISKCHGRWKFRESVFTF